MPAMDNLATNNLISNLPEERGWEYKQVSVTRVPGYGFGIAVSGGRDNPHFASGDPSIAVSDVLASGPAERLLQVNDRIITVNGISLQNVDYATAVQVLRDSGDTVALVIKRRLTQHQHSHSLSASYNGPPLAAMGINPLPTKVTLTKNSKKEDFGIILGCKLFIKDLSTKAKDQLISTNQILNEGDIITKINNTNCNDVMSLKEAKKIIDSCKDKLQITIARDITTSQNITHQPQSSISTTGAVNNFYKGDDFLTSGQSYSNQNLYVQPPTRAQNMIGNSSFDDNKLDMNSGPSSLPEDKSNLAPRGRSRGPLTDTSLSQFDSKCNLASGYGRSPSKSREEPPRPPPPRVEDYYGTRRQMYDEDPIVQKSKQPIPDARFITFHKEGSVGIRLTGGNFVGIFVTAVQPGSPASLQGLQPGDKILKVNDMDMTGVTREEAVLFLLSLQDRIELIVQFCKEEYDSIVASQKGDSFYIKTHFHYENPAKGEMAFRSGDVFHVIDTLYNGVVGCWQVFKIGRNNQEVQKGIIPNKSRAEELATAQFNATKKEMSANESRGNFFRRRRSSNRRSKSLGKEHWDDILFSDTMSKFPAYERVSLKHPGFTRPVILFGPIADVAREKLIKDFPDKFICPQLDASLDESGKSKNGSNIIRLSAIKDVISTGKHGILDITPNAVERLNYAQLYPIVVFFKADTKIVVKQLRQGLPKSAHKSSKKLLEQCQKLEKVWNHIFSSTILLNDNSDNWYRKVREIIDKQQSCALWMSESKPEESLSDDFLFPMSSLRLSYASSPESDLEHSPGPPVSTAHSVTGSSTAGRLTKASSDPSVIMNETSTTDTLPPYQPTYDSRFNYNQQQTEPQSPTSSKDQVFSLSNQDLASSLDNQNLYTKQNHHTNQNDYSDTNNYPKIDQRETEFPNERRIEFMNDKRHVEFNGKERQGDFSNMQHKRQQSTLHGHYNHSKGHSMSEQSVRRSPSKEMLYGSCPPDLPPRVDRGVKPLGMLTTPSKIPNGKSAHERLFGTKPSQTQENGEISNNIENGNFNKHSSSSLDRNQNSKSDSLSSYDSFSRQTNRIGPNAHDDLKTTLSKIEPVMGTVKGSPVKYNSNSQWESNSNNQSSKNDVKYGFVPNNAGKITATESPRNSKELDRSSRDSRDSRESERNIRELERNDRSLERNGREIEKEPSPMDTTVSPRGSIERDIYRYSRSPAKETIPGKTHFETKTDYGKYSRNNSSAQDYHRTSHQDLTASHLSIHQHQPSPMKMQHANHQSNHQPSHVNMNHQQGHMNHNGLENGSLPHIGQQNGMTTYKPVPPPKPKNYKPPYKGHQQYGPETAVQNNLPYSHGKSHSNPVDQRHPASPGVNYYYNMPSQPAWHTDSAFRPPGHYEPAYDARRHASIAYASRSEIAPLSPSYSYPDREPLDNRPPIVDLQGSREQRGSAFELYRKPVHFNMRSLQQSSSFGSQPNIPENLNSSTNSPKITPKLTKTQSFKHQKSESFSTPKFFRKLSFKGKGSSSKSNKNTKKISDYGTRPETTGIEGIYERSPRNMNRQTRPNKRDISSALVDSRGAKLVNSYWGVSLEIPEGAIPKGQKKEIYFVVSDPRLCQNAPPLDLENGETMLSPLVMCGPQVRISVESHRTTLSGQAIGTEFLKPVMLNIPHYANTLPSLGISLKATDSEQDVHTDWDNILLPSNHAANSVAVKVDHF